jgi:uncharacterized membrane protein YsdA (DUF1294 family)
MIAIYCAVMGAICFSMMAWDKFCAIKQRRRIPEMRLWSLAACGGSVGVLLGMFCFRHKLAKKGFYLPFYGICLLQVLVLGYWFYGGMNG